MKAALQRIQAARDMLGTGPTTRAYERVLTLASQAINTPPTSLKVQEFQAYLSIVFQRAQQEYQTAQARIIELTQRKQRR